MVLHLAIIVSIISLLVLRDVRLRWICWLPNVSTVSKTFVHGLEMLLVDLQVLLLFLQLAVSKDAVNSGVESERETSF